MPRQWKYAISMVLHPKKNRTERGKCKGLSLAVDAGKVPLKTIVRRLSEYCKRVGVQLEEQSSSRPDRSTTDVMFAICWLK